MLYDEAGRTVAITQSGPGHDHWSTGFLESYAYGYDDAGRQVFRMDEQGRINVYEYDEAGRIAAVHYPMSGGKSINDLWERIYLGVLSKELQCSEPDADKPGSRDAFREKLEQLLNDSPELTEMGFNVEEYLLQLEETVSEQAEVFEALDDFSWSFMAEESASASRATTQRYGHGGGWSGWGGTENRRGWGRWNWNGYSNRLPSGAHGWFASWKLPGYLHQAQWSEEYSYDERGNIVSMSNGWGTIEYEYDEENRLMRAGEREYDYDGNGNLTTETIGTMWAQYEYTPEDRVSSVITNQPGFISTVSRELEIGVAYGYDALGRRVSREEIVDLEASLGIERYGSRKNRESYLYDGLGFDVLSEGRDATKTESSGGWYTRSGRDFTPTTEYLYAGGTVIGRNDIAGGSFGAGAFGSEVKPSYYGQDILGSVVLETNEDGTKQKSYDYDAYGQLIEGKYSRISDLGYTGKRIDAVTGWYNYGYRDYDPMVMRFTTVDPIRSGSNWYIYVYNDPINAIDPNGLEMQIVGSAAYQAQTLSDMQALTRDTLAMLPDGTVIITNVSDAAGTLDSGTELVRRMNTKFNVTGRVQDTYIITIQETTSGNSYNTTNPVGAGNGIGTSGTVNYNPSSNPIILTTDPVTGYANPATRPPQIGLAHELIHADHARAGTMEGYLDASGNPRLAIGTYIYTDSTGMPIIVTTTPREVLRTVGLGYTSSTDVTENQIRQENGLCERAAY